MPSTGCRTPPLLNSLHLARYRPSTIEEILSDGVEHEVRPLWRHPRHQQFGQAALMQTDRVRERRAVGDVLHYPAIFLYGCVDELHPLLHGGIRVIAFPAHGVFLLSSRLQTGFTRVPTLLGSAVRHNREDGSWRGPAAP